MANQGEDTASEHGFFMGGTQAAAASTPPPALAPGIVRGETSSARGWGRGPIAVDTRKFRYDVNRARMKPALPFGATKVDRMDANDAGDALEHIHEMYGVHTEDEARIAAFDDALWFEHTVNGASMLQPGRGYLKVDGVSFDIGHIKTYLGEDQRRFFRAYADDIAECNMRVLKSYDPYDPVSAEMVGQIKQVALERGLQKYPHLAHDSSDACVSISMEERSALIASKRLVLPSVVNSVDALRGRVPGGAAPVVGAVGATKE